MVIWKKILPYLSIYNYCTKRQQNTVANFFSTKTNQAKAVELNLNFQQTFKNHARQS